MKNSYTLLKLMENGGPIMWIILFFSILALFVFLLKTFQFHREEINVRELLRGLFNVLKRNGLVEAITLCDNTPGPVAKLLAAAILAHKSGDTNIRSAIDDAVLEELPKLERHINLLGTIGYILPILGFLGTVLGILDAFETIQLKEYTSAPQFAASIKESLLTTAFALSVAIPCHIAYNFLVGKVDSMTADMEKASHEIITFFERQKNENEHSNPSNEE